MPPWDEHRAAQIIAEYKANDGATLPVLHALQAAFGFISDRAIEMTADALNLSRAEVYGVVTFYHDFRRAPAGAHVLKLCRAEACQSRGGDALAERLQRELKIGWGETTADGQVTLQPVFCLGLCACAPAAMLDGRLVGRLDDAGLDRLLTISRPSATSPESVALASGQLASTLPLSTPPASAPPAAARPAASQPAEAQSTPIQP